MPLMHALVVDDHPLYRETFCALLADCFPELQITTAADGSAALSLTRQRAFGLLVLDYQLPTITGGDVVRHLRARSQSRGERLLPIVLMSTQPDVARFVRTLGVQAFLSKPTSAAEVTAHIGPLLAEMPEAAAPRPRLWRIQPVGS